ncbi:M23 family metallopeptidase [Sutcliffiella halmapala]|uniref:M23 family metallopeptidase n=1 Tax=Sutcliffiella halmapala TaxID=79882 RepID=UPI000994ECD1|nr:M23 family metallopeptidase [Sutcliffiella halmapala]
MNERLDEIRRRAAKRKRTRQTQLTKHKQVSSYVMRDEEKYGNSYTSFEGGTDGNKEHPLFNRELFLFKILASAILVLVIGIMFQNQSAALEKPKQFVVDTMDKSFQFTAFTSWYEEQFGKPLALLPSTPKEKEVDQVKVEYAIPASGKVFESFQSNGQGVMVETLAGSKVEAMKNGTVTFVGIKQETGKTVIIQHADDTYSWYGQLGEVDVKFMDFIKTGTAIGRTTTLEDGSKGMFYFAIQKGNEFIDPMQVISFE